MNHIQQNVLVQKLIDYKLRKNNRNKQKALQYSPPKMPISQRQTSMPSSNAYAIHLRLKQIQSYAAVSDLLDLLAQMFRMVQQYEQQASHLWLRNLELLSKVRVPLQEENVQLKAQLETLKQNDVQNSLFGQLREYSEEKPKRKVIDLENISREQNFQEEFMARVPEFSLSWRQEAQQLKQKP